MCHAPAFPEVSVDHCGVLGYVARLPFGQNRAPVQHQKAIDQSHHCLHRVFNDDYGDAFSGQFTHQGQDFFDSAAAQPGQGLVEQQQSRFSRQGAGQLQQTHLLVG